MRTLPDGERVELVKPVFAFKGPTPAQFSARQAPQVIGMGLIEALAETTILAQADPNDANGDGVRGIPNWIVDPETGKTHLGRFGWKASKASLRHQVGDALIKDMGVTSPTFPTRGCQRGAPDCRSASATSVTEGELQRLTHYLSLIGVPAQRSLRSGFPDGIRVSPEHDVDPPLIARGAALFNQVRCVACHTATMQTGNTHPFAELRNQTIHPYSDLLLHDMGPNLADSLREANAAPNLWRTAPLWGVGSLRFVQGGDQNVRLLHDGRARSMLEAILWHGGEADSSRTQFEALPKADRDAVVAFLQSL
ncbi:Cytochrome c [compost metagenome]